MQLSETLKASLTNEEIRLAAEIGARAIPLTEKIDLLFKELPDPLLSALEISELLCMNGATANLDENLKQMVLDQQLEYSTTTQRPLDPSNVILYRIRTEEVQRLRIFGLASRSRGRNDGLGEESSDINLQFSIDGRLIRTFARIDRLDAVAGTGNQREEIIKHVRAIAKGMADGKPVPNSILLVFNEAIFVVDPTPEEETQIPKSHVLCRYLTPDWTMVNHPTAPGRLCQEIRSVELDIPHRNAAFDEEKVALLVDGQQRTAALALVDIDENPNFQLCVNATVGDDSRAKLVFQVANSTVKISTEFSRALVATVDDDTPGYIPSEKLIARAVKLLSIDDKSSPFHNITKHPGHRITNAPIAYNTLFMVVSIFDSSGLDFKDDSKLLAECVKKAFNLVKKVWGTAWGIAPRDSKLMHGAGLRAISAVLIDLIEANHRNHNFDWNHVSVWQETENSLKRLASRVLWTADAMKGTKQQKDVYQNEISPRQNTNQDIEKLTRFLLKEVNYLDKKANVGVQMT